MSDHQQYERIYNFLSSLKCADDKVAEIKDVYVDIINSKRRLHAIKSIKDLLKILQKRDHINPEKIGALIGLAECFDGIPFETFTAANTVNNNQNVNGNIIYVTQPSPNLVLPRLPPDLRERVYQVIASDIGKKWTDFARALHVPEGYIDELYYAQRNCHNRVYEILRYHQERCDPRLWRSSLLDALTKARRNDLMQRVQTIFDTHYP
ncbi:hypothetical protein Zmor_013880 [Zophobas morio]|uniref:Death domain-containing protein n=1 Tax=Zophobas morio TaxID=2755281 RepID=A0AA38IGT7_9CUCU|nr:hypothetical protein Zmor_013880 [Zophobas morio]